MDGDVPWTELAEPSLLNRLIRELPEAQNFPGIIDCQKCSIGRMRLTLRKCLKGDVLFFRCPRRHCQTFKSPRMLLKDGVYKNNFAHSSSIIESERGSKQSKSHNSNTGKCNPKKYNDLRCDARFGEVRRRARFRRSEEMKRADIFPANNNNKETLVRMVMVPKSTSELRMQCSAPADGRITHEEQDEKLFAEDAVTNAVLEKIFDNNDDMVEKELAHVNFSLTPGWAEDSADVDLAWSNVMEDDDDNKFLTIGDRKFSFHIIHKILRDCDEAEFGLQVSGTVQDKDPGPTLLALTS